MFQLEKGNPDSLMGQCIIYSKNSNTMEIYGIYVCATMGQLRKFQEKELDKETEKAWENVAESIDDVVPPMFVNYINSQDKEIIDSAQCDVLYAGAVSSTDLAKQLIDRLGVAYMANFLTQKEHNTTFEYAPFTMISGTPYSLKEDFMVCVESIGIKGVITLYTNIKEDDDEEGIEFKSEKICFDSLEEAIAHGGDVVYGGKTKDTLVYPCLEAMAFAYAIRYVERDSEQLLQEANPKTCADYKGEELRRELRMRAEKIRPKDSATLEDAVEEMKRFTEGTQLHKYALKIIQYAQSRSPKQQEIMDTCIEQMIAIESEDYEKAGSLQKRIDELTG